MEVSAISPISNKSQANPLAATDSFGFADLIDVINPLQHIPIVNNIYRSLTGDTIGGFANVVGSTLFGGPIGGGVALANEIVKTDTGKSITEHAMGGVSGRDASKSSFVAEKYETAEKITEESNTRKSTTHDWIYGGTFMA